MIKLTTEIIREKDFNPEFGFLIDFRRASINMTTKELQSLGNWKTENLYLSELKRLAILTDNADQVAKSMIITLNIKTHSINYKIFSTLEASINCLEIENSYLDLIRNEICELAKNDE